MNKLHYYNPAISPEIITCLLNRAIEIQDDNSFNPGKYLFASCYRAFPAFAVRLSHLEKYCSMFTEKELVSGLEMFAVNRTGWLIPGEHDSTDEFFSAIAGLHEINTYQFLFNSFIRLQRIDAVGLPLSLRSGMNLLVNRFERTGRLYDSYHSDFKPVGTTFSFGYNYTLLPLCLLRMFELEKKLQFFSTALKGVDVLSYLSSLMEDADVALSALAAIFLRDHLLREYYDYRKLRLPPY